jgi:ribosomal protein S27AE
MNKEFNKHINKVVANTEINTELSPGSAGRRYEPVGGVQKHNERIHRESAYVDKYKNLPFEFSKPKKPKKVVTKVCSNCGTYVSVTKHTIGVICNKCHTYAKVKEVTVEEE